MKFAFVATLTLISSVWGQKSQGITTLPAPPAPPATTTPTPVTPPTVTPPVTPPTAPLVTPPKVTGTTSPSPSIPSTVVNSPPSPAASVDWSMNGHNWVDGLCSSGNFQSPINIDSKSVTENNKVKFAFDFQSYENLTLQLNDQAGSL